MDSTEKYLTFEVADGLYALPIYTVREIISDGSDVTLRLPGGNLVNASYTSAGMWCP